MNKTILSIILLGLFTNQAFALSAKMADSVNSFTLEIGKYLAKTKPQDNAFISPLSISSALAMTASGAKGATLKEMQKTLRLPPFAHEEYKKLMSQLSLTQESSLHLANRLWGNKGADYNKEFIETLIKNYGSSVESLDFANASEASRIIINKWIAEQTQNKIKDLLSPGSISPSTSSVLTNAIYFKGKWEYPFKLKDNYQGDFFISANEKKPTTFMQLSKHIPYEENADYQKIEMPYKNREISFVVLLPKEDKNLNEIEKKLSRKDFLPIKSESLENEVDVTLPKFTSEISYELSSMLQSLGIKSAFNSSLADFSGMRPKNKAANFYISSVIHKAFIELNEEGTEAAAATAIIIKATAMPMNRVYFRANHPFIYFIRHEASGAILFYGRFIKP